VRQLYDHYLKDRDDVLAYIRYELDSNELCNVDEVFDNVNYVMID
jgi:hypothetical protein